MSYVLFIDGKEHKEFREVDDALSYAYDFEMVAQKKQPNLGEGQWVHDYDVRKIDYQDIYYSKFKTIQEALGFEELVLNSDLSLFDETDEKILRRAKNRELTEEYWKILIREKENSDD